jgi:hypothetical protein
MAITIIGASSSAEPSKSPLPEVPSASLPAPSTAPAAHHLLSAERLRALLAHESPLARSFAVEQLLTRELPELNPDLVARVSDPDARVAEAAVETLAARRHTDAADAVLARFSTASGALAAACAAALGELAPARVLEAVKARGRLDEQAYASAISTLAIHVDDDAESHLSRALDRAGALEPARRTSLYGATLLTGRESLVGRVLGLAISDSARPPEDEGPSPSRVPLSALAGLPPFASRPEAHAEVFAHAERLISEDVLPALPEAERAALEGALSTRQPATAIAALAPVLALPEPAPREGRPDAFASVARRRRGLLAALLARVEAIGRLPSEAGALFVAAAASAAAVVCVGAAQEAQSPGAVALSRALEGALRPEEVGSSSLEALTEAFRKKSPHEARRLAVILVRERFVEVDTRRRLARALLLAGHGLTLLEAAAESDDREARAQIVEAVRHAPAEAEAAIVEALSASPLDPKTARLAVEAAEPLRTERVGLAIGRRFAELRKIAGRDATTRAIMRVGDPRLLPILASRAFPHEPEELAWVVLALVSDAPRDERFEAALARTLRPVEGEPDEPLRLPLRCKTCDETLVYGFEHAYVSPEAKHPNGDPAFVGDVVCKACGAVDALEAEGEAVEVLTAHMMLLLEAAERQQAPERPPAVTPASIEVGGKRVGMAEALRSLDADLAASPSSIRLRLRRARLRMILKRSGAMDDVLAVKAESAQAVEALTVEATLLMRRGELQLAAERCLEGIGLLDRDEARLYEEVDPAALREQLEDFLLELTRAGAALPAEVSLKEAERRRRARELARAAEARSARAEDEAPPSPVEPRRALAPGGLDEALRQAGRNDACPCGSGKKFKKCHGAGKAGSP